MYTTFFNKHGYKPVQTRRLDISKVSVSNKPNLSSGKKNNNTFFKFLLHKMQHILRKLIKCDFVHVHFDT